MKDTFNEAYPDEYGAVDQAPASVRADFIVKTYTHLTGAVVAFVALLAAMIQGFGAAGILEPLLMKMTGGMGWLVVLGVYMGVSMIAQRWAQSDTSVALQYFGLGLYIVAMSLITLPLIYVAASYGGPNVIPSAAIMTLGLFAGLTAIVFITREDFSFMKGILMLGGMVALGLIVCSILFDFSLGLVFTVAMIALMCGYILYETSNVLHHYRPGQHVAASLALFAALATLFWYVLRLFMARD